MPMTTRSSNELSVCLQRCAMLEKQVELLTTQKSSPNPDDVVCIPNKHKNKYVLVLKNQWHVRRDTPDFTVYYQN